MKKILMVCLGNICRSPIAHGIAEHLSQEEKLNWDVDSAGTSGWHNGEPPDPRSIEVGKINGIDISHQISRIITPSDLDHYDYIFAMDTSNLKEIQKLASKDQLNKIHLFLDFADIKERENVPDPYYDGGFDYVFSLIFKACKNLVKKLN